MWWSAMAARRRGREPTAADRALFETALGAVKPLPGARGAERADDARSAARLRRGRMRPEARLDLHGHTLDNALRALNGFIDRAAHEGMRCVLVITGKGPVGRAGGTIRSEFPRWLNRADLRPRILAFAEAQPRDGGAGAFYVLLRKRRG